MPSVNLPDHWTVRDMLLMYEFLTEVQESIWRVYGTELMEAYRQEECGGDDDTALQVGGWIDGHGESDF